MSAGTKEFRSRRFRRDNLDLTEPSRRSNLAAMASPIRSIRDGKTPPVSMEELARRAGVSTQTVFRVETGRSRGSVQTLMRLATALDVSLEDVLPGAAEEAEAVPAA